MKLYFIRHGETDWNIQKRLQGQEDIPMNAAGREQAAQCAEYLSMYWKAEGFSEPLIVSSSLSRARDTAIKIAEGLNIPKEEIIQDRRLMERDYGLQSGMTYEERSKYEKVHPTDSEIESREHTAQRVWEAAEHYMELCREHNQGHLILVTHGGCIRSMLRKLEKLEIDWDKPLLNAGVTILENTDGKRFRLAVHNQSAENLYRAVIQHSGAGNP